MPYAGKTIIPREIAAECHRYWINYELTKAVATALGESAGSLGAWHDNLAAGVASRDCGLFQINIPASKIGTPDEFALRTESLDPAEYMPVMHTNVDRARQLYLARWMRGGESDIRRWQAWVAYTTGWATFPEFWVWHQDADGNPIGPWIATGRYIQRAICGQMNYHVVIKGDWDIQKALYYGARYAEHFGVKADLIVKPQKNGPDVIGFQTPPKPVDPPADGVGPRPVPNNGV